MSISIKEIQTLRRLTGVGIMDCKLALKEADGDIEEAKRLLRIKGLNKTNKRADSETNEGIVAIYKDENVASIILLSSETDFVAMNVKFSQLACNIAKMATENLDKDKNELLAVKYLESNNTLAEEIKETAFVMGENIALNKIDTLSINSGVISSYVHAGSVAGRMAALVAIESNSGVNEDLKMLGHKIAMHVVATAPLAIDIDQLDPMIVERECSVVREQAIASGKPENIVEKIVEGRLNKFYQESVLLKQAYCANNSLSISDLLMQYAKDHDVHPKIIAYKFYKVGEK
ncbi:Elongation factor Ts [Candidatus Xenohaliotis californiensis]|uniref:Elongation factor Ts n=1 Tax=Candidatus Xenohaliotis californiensis TaxID=84677 RepID=A0ABM9N8B4_9RICK|nr:Elongation factor Ts [Candidatus Xenohaliotis californiensis]